ncbi:septum formation inhibitor Maf [Flavobacterium sp. ALD4]|uniref:septum formation inhibitor Maf n=1 Tax=Flavobacterium sp. ALD4 TaxID=2058314 RepID=UPI000C341915|nr:septum formation inhibitor Maf [Flavobacterium sp. ALD4]PKH68977.1 septum formation inhibitor Maf [Flavobacterium sp. ALD4]
MKFKTTIICTIAALCIAACGKSQKIDLVDKREITQDFKKYWFNGEAELSSFQLTQARYGELREGKAVMIFVTEPFSTTKLVKVDQPTEKDISVLKLNFTKNFITGIYPYSMMTSSFLPIYENQHALKITTSIQEWCGQVFVQLENRDVFEVQLHSYFENEGEQKLTLPKEDLEDEIWSLIRMSPEKLPIGELKMLPSFFYLRLTHQKMEFHNVIASLEKQQNDTSCYTLDYKRLNRKLKIYFENKFPYRIVKFEESYPDGFEAKQILTTTGLLINSIRSPYWQKNGVIDAHLRKEMGL